MLYTILAGTVLAVVGVGFIAWQAGATQGRSDTATPASNAPPKPAENEATDESAVVEETKLAVKGLLDILTQSVGHFIDRVDRYDRTIDQHRADIENAVTLENIKRIEETMLSNLDSLQRANEEYRTQLADAHQQLERQQVEMEKLQIDVGTDFLTGLPNRRALDARLAENVDRSNRYGTKFSIIILDIDHFKQVNDTHGHVAGDRILRAVANLLAEHMRSSDFLGRYGGEEFVMILPETSDEQAAKMAERVRVRIAGTKYKFGEEVMEITISGGVGEVYQPEDTATNLFERVDAALYKAKRGGRDRIERTL